MHAEKKKHDEDAAKKKKAVYEAAKKKKAEEVEKERKAAQEKRQEDLANHVTKLLYMLTQAGVQFMKDIPQLGKVGHLIYFAALDSELKHVLLHDLSITVMVQCYIENLTFTYAIHTVRITFNLAKGTLKFLSFENDLLEHL